MKTRIKNDKQQIDFWNNIENYEKKKTKKNCDILIKSMNIYGNL